MILYQNLNFFDKQGKKLNLKKEEYINVVINRNDDTVVDYLDAKIEAITNVYGNIEMFHIVAPGTLYNEKTTILITDKETDASYLIDSSEFITLGAGGEILAINLPSNPTGFCYPSFTYSGEVFFPKISVGLIETAQIYILEEMEDETSKESVYSSPRTYKDISNNTTTELHAMFTTNEDSEITLFDVDYDSDKYPFVETIKKSTAILDNGETDIIDNATRQVTLLKSNAMLFNVYAKSDNEGIYERTLALYETVSENNYVLATIKFRAEIEDEDERLRSMLDTFAIQISAQEEKIFRDSDVNEELPNYLLLNEKRKEMLLEYHNIYPYIGSYKALANIINYFGYGDTRLKEYWLNTKMTKSLKTKNSLSAMSSSTNLPIDLTSLHSFANAFKPLPILKRTDSNLTSNVENTPDFIAPKFDENNVDILNKDSGNLTSFPNIREGKGVIGKIPYKIPDDIKVPVSYNERIKNPIDSIQLINAIQSNVNMPVDESTISTIYEQHFKQIEIPLQLKDKGKHWQSEEMLPNKVWKKTNLFGLFYDITKESGDYDVYGMPITEDAFIFSEDEVLIKLFALREYLKEKFMPLNARIIDIVGEGVYFERFSVNIWKDDVVNYDVNQSEVVDFEIDAGEEIILDLQNYGYPTQPPTSSTNISTLQNVFLNNFVNSGTFKNDDGPVGCTLKATSQDFEITWNELDVTWDDLVVDTRAVRRAYTDGSTTSPQISFDVINRNIEVNFVVKNNEIVPHFTEIIMHSEDSFGNPYTQRLDVLSWDPITKIMHIEEIDGDFAINTNSWIEYIYYMNNLSSRTWDTIAQGEYYEIEWYISHEFAGKFDYNVRGNINTHKEITVDLPYTGKYRITCILYDLTNHSVRKTKEVTVKMPNIDFMCFGRSINPIDTWDELNETSWDELYTQWRTAAYGNNVTWDDLNGITWDDLMIERYQEQTDPFIQNTQKDIIRISEKDRYVGNITAIDILSNTIVCTGHLTTPMLRDGVGGIPFDYVFLRYGDIVYRTGVVTADYSTPGKTILIVESLPEGVQTYWEILREIGNTVLVTGDITATTNTTEGVSVGQYALFEKNEEDVPENTKVPISDIIQPDVVQGQDDIQGITLPITIKKYPSEYGRIYKVRNIAEVASPGIESFSYDQINKTVTLNYTPSDGEIIPGFTILNVYSTNYDSTTSEQRLLVQHISGSVLNVVELDSDMGVMYEAWMNTISYEYWQFTVKLRHFIDILEDVNDVYLNFNDYPYQSDFVINGTPEYGLNGDWYFDYIIKDGSFSLEITNIGFEGENTLLTLNDPTSELYRLSPKFKMSWVTFDEDYADKRFGTEIFEWDNMDEVSWDDLNHLTWNMFEYQKAPLCGFKIIKVAPNGRIQFNELPFFEFTKVPAIGQLIPIGSPSSMAPATEYDQFRLAVDELNTTDNEGLSRFVYNLVTDNATPGEYFITATAKGEGVYFVGYIQFDAGVYGEYSDPSTSHSYPTGTFTQWVNPYLYGLENQYANWNPVARAYYEYGYDPAGNRGWYPAEKIDDTVSPSERYVYNAESNKFLFYNPSDLTDPIYAKFPSLLNSVKWRYDEAYRLMYDYAITSPFTWDDLIVSKSNIEIGKMTTLFFVATNTKVAGKKSYRWTIRNRDTNEDMCVVTKKYAIWTFTQAGRFDVSLEVIDVNGNTVSLNKKAFVIVT